MQSLGSRLSSNKNFESIRNSNFFLKDVSVDFGTIKSLKNIQLVVEKNEILFVTGASGAGKTTLLRLLTGDLDPTSGQVVFPKASKFVAPVFQDLRLLENRSCEENLWVSYDRSIHQNKENFLKDLIELSRVFGIKERLSLKVKDANGGLKQKVALIRAILSKPDILVLDEPTSSLDAQNAQKLFDVLNYYNTKQGLTVVWATHNKELVQRFSGRIVHLDRGKLVYTGHACFI